MSLPSDIVQLFGTGSVPAIVGGTVLGVFELGERLASQRFKDDVSKWLLTFDVQKARALPDGTQELFERIFGERHFSLNCFVRSAACSLGAIAFMGILCLLINPKEAIGFLRTTFFGETLFGDWFDFGLWLPWSIIIDYVSLFKTRVILRIITRMQRANTILSVAILIMDYILYRLLFIIGISANVILALYLNRRINTTFDLPALDVIRGLPVKMLFVVDVPFFPLPMDDVLIFIFFWSGFAPSLWLWLYVFALFVTRTLLRSERIVNWLRYFLDVEKAPFRSIGAVAATLAFIASVAIILVSVEVSRISAVS